MKRSVLSVAIAMTGILTAVVGAQSEAGRMSSHGDHAMEMAKIVTYTGCLQAGPMGANTFVLAHPAMVDQGHKDAMMKDSGKMMMHDHDMTDGGMAPMTLTATGAAIDLGKHVGHKVSVTGSVTKGAMDASRGEASTLAIKSLKMVAKSCM